MAKILQIKAKALAMSLLELNMVAEAPINRTFALPHQINCM